MLSARLFNLPPSRSTALRALLAILGAAILQEGFQALDSGSLVAQGAVFDFGVDLVGGALGFLAAVILVKGSRRRNPGRT